ncbi:hypothetical protein ACOME3_009522 [Neoechinorhynchus agilis]
MIIVSLVRLKDILLSIRLIFTMTEEEATTILYDLIFRPVLVRHVKNLEKVNSGQISRVQDETSNIIFFAPWIRSLQPIEMPMVQDIEVNQLGGYGERFIVKTVFGRTISLLIRHLITIHSFVMKTKCFTGSFQVFTRASMSISVPSFTFRVTYFLITGDIIYRSLCEDLTQALLKVKVLNT